jgi:hypothetical protein
MNIMSDPARSLQLLEGYLAAGERRAADLGNRGPIRYGPDGRLDPGILDAYGRVGFYILEGVVDPEELEDLKTELVDALDRTPAHKGGPVDRYGNPAVGAGFDPPVVTWSKPLSDPYGGTDLLSGRHAVKMFEPEPAPDAPSEIAWAIAGILQFSDAALRAYGHPDLLAVAEAINGPDFTPFNEALIAKPPGLGVSFAWHQDGVTHWGARDWDAFTHGFNFMLQLYGCTAANGLWYVPGSHHLGKVDIKALVAEAGGNLLPDAVPLICKPGDVAISNRQIVHGSFPNTSGDVRMTLNMGFHRRKSVLDVEGACYEGRRLTHDAEIVRKRSELIGYAIDARRRRYPDERPFDYRPHIESGERLVWNEAARAAISQYNRFDLVI